MTDTGCTLAMTDEEMRKISPVPSGCGENPSIVCCRPRQWGRHSLRDSASYGRIFARNAIRPNSVNGP